MELGAKIKQLRSKAGLTQEQLADKLSVSAQSVSKWENAVAMPDITLLPAIAEEFGVSIDELFDLTVEQKLNRIENHMDMEEELPRDVFWDYEEFLKAKIGTEEHKLRATALLAHLYGHAMRANAQKVRKYAKEAIMMAPEQKDCQWLLNMAAGQVIWDWNLANHTSIINFYKEVITSDKVEPHTPLPYYYLIDNLLADHRADEAEKYLAEFAKLPAHNPVMVEVYRAHIALARFDAPKADAIIEALVQSNPTSSDVLFEAAQYYAKKCEYARAIPLYQQSYDVDPQKPRYTDAPMAISELYELMGDYRAAAKAYEDVIANMRDEWGMTEEVELKNALKEHARLLALIQ